MNERTEERKDIRKEGWKGGRNEERMGGKKDGR